MKNFRRILNILGIFWVGVLLFSCNKQEKNLWEQEVKVTEKIEITDLSGIFYDTNQSLEDFQVKYPWFQGDISDAEYALRKKDTAEIRVYSEAIKLINKAKLETELSEMFSRVKYYFPKFKVPKVYLYSSNLQGITEYPVIFTSNQEGEFLFIDISAFMGEKNKNYEGLEHYFRKSMNPENIVPKVSEAVAETFMIVNPQEKKFLDQILFEGKKKILQDAFLPKTADYLKMNYTSQQQEWSSANEENIWNYFVENDLLFSDDQRLYERFIAIGPFSKFYTEVDQKSSPRVGVFIGWQIARSFFEEHSDKKLEEFLRMNATEIFNQSNYKPTK